LGSLSAELTLPDIGLTPLCQGEQDAREPHSTRGTSGILWPSGGYTVIGSLDWKSETKQSCIGLHFFEMYHHITFIPTLSPALSSWSADCSNQFKVSGMSRATDPISVPASAFMLADHLDAALAAGEDILAAGERASGNMAPGLPEHRRSATEASAALRTCVELIRALELALITRVLKAREWSATLSAQDQRFRMIGSLFLSGTLPLVDALAEFADATEADFETGDGITAYFRNRGTISAEAAGLNVIPGPLVTDTFRIAGRIEVGALLDLVAAYLDAMEVHFTLFGNGDPSAGQQREAASASA
jgi:hypothetical protein